MKKYSCHKVVHAAKIIDFAHMGIQKKCIFTVEGAKEGETEHVETAADVLSRGNPEPGDYLVCYGKGTDKEYYSHSPADVFEEGYTITADKPSK